MKKSLFNKYTGLLIVGLFFTHLLSAQDIINGRVFNVDNRAVKGAKISLEQSPDNIVETDNNGTFSLAGKIGDIIIIKAGNVAKSFVLNKSGSVYKLEDYEGSVQLGYNNSVNADFLTSSVSTVHSNDLNRFTVFDPSNALYGQLNGLIVLQNGGPPWSRKPDMMIRGVGTLNDNSFTVFIDGFERKLSSLTVDEIESISVLKDAASLAIYGQQGANGILLINTKRGEFNTFNVDVKYQDGFNSPFRLPNFLDAYHYAEAVNEASALDGNPFVYSEWDLQDYKDGSKPYFYPNVNWIKEAFKEHGRNNNFTAQFSGGGKNIKYYSLINYQTEKGFFKNTDFDPRYDSQLKYRRLNVRANIDAHVTKTTLLRADIGANMGERKYPGSGISNIMNAIYNIPSAALPVRSLNGYWGGTDYYGNNPAALIGAKGYRLDFSRDLMADLIINQDLDFLLKGVSLEIAASVDNTALYNEGITKDFEYEVVNVVRDENTGEITDTISKLYGVESDLTNYNGGITQWRQAAFWAKVNYQNTWGKHNLHSTLMFNQSKEVADGQYNTWLAQNYMSVTRYNYKQKYFADLTLGFSGSSNLPDNDWFGFFPAISGAWILSSEDFMKNSNVFNFLKVRASWGIVGNDKMEQNLSDQKFNGGGSYFYTDNFNSLSGYKPDRLGTKGLTYEKSYKTNIGIDMIIFDNLTVSADAFYDRRKDILVDSNPVVSDVLGVTPPKVNMGIVDNKGIELSILWKNYIGKAMYYIGGNFDFYRNKIIEQNEEYRPYDYLKRTGLPVGQMFGYQSLGFFKDSADIANSPVQLFSTVRPGDVKYKDMNNDGRIDKFDESAIGYSSRNPEIYYSFKLGFEYAGFAVDLLFQGIAHQTKYLNTESVYWPLRNYKSITDFSAPRWVPNNMNEAKLPRLTLMENANNYRQNSIWLQNSDFLKLRSLVVSYNLPKKWIEWSHLKETKFFVKGQNLFSIDNIKNVNPEVIGIVYPTLSSWYFGISANF
jgi:TonB-linked SusC/RagA family outer membrane protein